MTLTLYPGTEVVPLTAERVQASRRTDHLGREVIHLPRIGSTNDAVRVLAQHGAAEGLLVLTEEQTAGRGRRGRSWQAPFGSSLLCSLLLRPTFLPTEQCFLLTALTSLAVAQAITGETGLQPVLKWPNDLLLGGRKVCGILVELEGELGQLHWAIIGWGLNVNVAFGNDPLADQATSLAVELGRSLPRLPLLWACLEEVEAHYHALWAGRAEEIWATWRGRLSSLGHPVEVVAPEGSFTGQAIDVAPDGALLVRRGDGTVVRVLAGDIIEHLPS